MNGWRWERRSWWLIGGDKTNIMTHRGLTSPLLHSRSRGRGSGRCSVGIIEVIKMVVPLPLIQIPRRPTTTYTLLSLSTGRQNARLEAYLWIMVSFLLESKLVCYWEEGGIICNVHSVPTWNFKSRSSFTEFRMRGFETIVLIST